VNDFVGLRVDQDDFRRLDGGNGEILSIRRQRGSGDFRADRNFSGYGVLVRVDAGDVLSRRTNRVELALCVEDLAGRCIERDGAGAAEAGEIGDDDRLLGCAGDEEPRLIARGAFVGAAR
jgi:hypothetical protein